MPAPAVNDIIVSEAIRKRQIILKTEALMVNSCEIVLDMDRQPFAFSFVPALGCFRPKAAI